MHPTGHKTPSPSSIVVIKVGGSVLEKLSDTFFQECVQLLNAGWSPVIVHGGGPEINRLQQRAGVEPKFVDGLRVTDDETLEWVEMVLAGRINKKLVTVLEQAGASAVGLSGVDRGMIRVRPADARLGWVGEVTRVEPEPLHFLLSMGWIPVVGSLGVDEKGQHYNVNADTAAGAVAEALGAEKMVMVTDVPGIRRNRNGVEEWISCLTTKEIDDLIRSGDIHGGMIPKVKAAMSGLGGSVREVIITSGTVPDCLNAVWQPDGAGTVIIKEDERNGTLSHLSS
jgi:acetylglutamate kinase